MPAAVKRRTQAQRRETTIGRLVDATISILAESGYSQLTVAAVCKRADLSQGALFRHFGSRVALIAGATEEVCVRHLGLLESELTAVSGGSGASPIAALVTSLRAAARTPEHAAWHEVMVAARTNSELHALVAPTLERFEHSLLDKISVLDTGATKPGRLGTVLLSLMHLMDSEAVTVAVYPSPALEADRVDWLVEVLGRELGVSLNG